MRKPRQRLLVTDEPFYRLFGVTYMTRDEYPPGSPDVPRVGDVVEADPDEVPDADGDLEVTFNGAHHAISVAVLAEVV